MDLTDNFLNFGQFLFCREKQSDYIEKLYSISTKPKMALECFEIFSEKLEKNHNEALRDMLLKYLGRIWIENDLSSALLNENLVCYKDNLLKITARY